MTNLVFQLPVYRNNKIKEWVNIAPHSDSAEKSPHGYADLWALTSYPRPKEDASLFLASA